MSQVAFVFRIPNLGKADAGTFIDTAELVRDRIRQDLGVRVSVVQIVKSDTNLVPVEFADVGTPTTNAVASRSGTVTHVSSTIAGAAAGNHTVTGIKTTDELVAVVHVDDTTHAGTDKTSEYTISAADTINNTAGTTSVGSHVVVAYRRS